MSFFYKENKALEEKVNRYFDGLSDFNNKHFDGKLSVVLLGSLSRGEGSWINESGRDILVSDIEFFTVYPDETASFKEYDEFINSYAKEMFGENASSLFHADNSYVSKSKMKSMEKKLLTYDAVHFGKCVVGEDVVPLFPKIDIHNINLYDIRDILTHRVFAVLYYGFPLKEQGNEAEYRYCLAKNSLDLMTVLLVENGILESGFINRYNKIKLLSIDEKIKDYFGYCLSLKLGEPYDTSFTTEEMEGIFISLVKELNRNFKLKAENILSNIRHIVRRRLGMLKRTLKYKNIAFSKPHLNRLITSFDKKEKITEKEIKDNLVLNGYPV